MKTKEELMLMSFEDAYDYCRENDEDLWWDGVNHEETIQAYISDMMTKGIRVNHILKAIETNPSSTDIYSIWLGNSMETPTPINKVSELLVALAY